MMLSFYLCFAGDVFAAIVNQRTGTSYNNLYDAVNASQTVSGDVLELNSNTNIGDNNHDVEVSKNLTINGNGYVLKSERNNLELKINSNYTLNCENLTIQGTGNDSNYNFITVYSGAKLNMDSKTKITGFKGKATISINGGTVNGGTVTGNHNSKDDNGVIYVSNEGSQTPVLSNCFITNNTIRNSSNACVVSLNKNNAVMVNCVVAGNMGNGSNPQAIFPKNTSYIINCTVVSNTGMYGYYQTGNNNKTKVQNSIFWNNSKGNFYNQNQPTKNYVVESNPHLDDDYSLTDESTNCIDKGNNQYYTGATYGTVDVIGNPRKDGTIDIGAFEKVNGTKYYAKLTAQGNDGVVLSSDFSSTDRTLKSADGYYTFLVNPVSTDQTKTTDVQPTTDKITIGGVTYIFDHWELESSDGKRTQVTGNVLEFNKTQGKAYTYVAVYKSDRCALISASKSTDLKWGETVKFKMESCDYEKGYLIQWQGSNDKTNEEAWEDMTNEVSTIYSLNPYNKDSYKYYRIKITYKGKSCYSNVIELTPAPCGVSWEVVDAKGEELRQQFTVNPTLRSYVVDGETQYTVRLNAINSTEVKITALNQRIPVEDGTSTNDNRIWTWPSTSNSILGKVVDNAFVVKSADVTYEYEMKYLDCEGKTQIEHFIVRVDFSCKSKDSEVIWSDDFGSFNGGQYTYTKDNGEKATIIADNSRTKYAVKDQNGAVVNHNYFSNWDAQDGYYAIVKLGSDASNNFNQDKYYDRTSGNGTGGMLVVNFANTKGITFYQRDIPARDCDGALVYLSCYIAGVQGGKNATTGSYSDIANWSNSTRIHEPNVKMEVWSLANNGEEDQLKATFYSGDVPNPNHGKDDWVNLSAYFKMEKNVRYRMKLINNKNQQYGNDVRFDDISAVACYPNLQITDDPKVVDESKTGIVVCGTKSDTVTLYASVGGDIKKYYDNPYYLYQYRKDENSPWVNFNKQDHGADSCRVAMLDVDPGVQMRAIVAKDKAMVDWVCARYVDSTKKYTNPADEAKRYPKVDCAHPYGYSFGFTIDYFPALEDLESSEQYVCSGDPVELSYNVPVQYTNMEWYDVSEETPVKLPSTVPSYSFTMAKPSYEHWLVVKNEQGQCPDTVKFTTKLNTSVSLNCLVDEKINTSSASCGAIYKGKPTAVSCVEDAVYTFSYALDDDDAFTSWNEEDGILLSLGGHTIHWKVNMTSEEYVLSKTATCSQSITVLDKTAPVISEIESQTAVAIASDPCSFQIPDLSAIVLDKTLDNCSGTNNTIVSQLPVVGTKVVADATAKTEVVTVVVKDESENTSEVTVNVVIPGVPAPSVQCESHAFISYDGAVDVPLPVDADGRDCQWTLVGGDPRVHIEEGRIKGTLPFGTTPIKLKAEYCSRTAECEPQIRIIEQKPACGE